jgi:hypothetical protein
MMQDMMKMMEKFTKSQDYISSGCQQQSTEVAMMTEQYNTNPSRGEAPG